MSSDARLVEQDSDRALQPGTLGFTVVTSLSIGMTALAIDTILPAFAEIRAHLGLEPGATELTVLVSAFLIGFGIGQLPAGLLADRFGRRPVLWGGLALYIVAALITSLAPSLWTMAAARFVWGLGAAGPRVAVTAMVRDAFSGEQMARQMSMIMAVFLMIPMFAPGLGAGLLAFGSWRWTIWICAILGLVAVGLGTRLPATLPADQRRSLSLGEIVASWRMVLSAPATVPYMIAITLATGVFLSYLASSENFFDTVFGLGDWFPVIFGVMAVGLALASTLNGRIVETVGLPRMMRLSTIAFVVSAGGMVGLSLASSGTPNFWAFAPVMLAALMALQVAIVNANTAAMIPLGHVAGSGAALLGMVPLVFGSLLGSAIDQQFDGSMTPLSVAFLGASVLVLVIIRYALRITDVAAADSPAGHEVDCLEVGIGG